MADLRKKASMQQVMDDIKPYITKHFMAQSTVQERDIAAICQILLPRYKNVKLLQGLQNEQPCLKIQVKGLLSTDEKQFGIIENQKKRHSAKPNKKRDLSWIDELEIIDAALDDG
jgi:hypothetical protein